MLVVSVMAAIIVAYYNFSVYNLGSWPYIMCTVNNTSVVVYNIMVANNYLPVMGASVTGVTSTVGVIVSVSTRTVNGYFITGLNVIGAVTRWQRPSENPAATV